MISEGEMETSLTMTKCGCTLILIGRQTIPFLPSEHHSFQESGTSKLLGCPGRLRRGHLCCSCGSKKKKKTAEELEREQFPHILEIFQEKSEDENFTRFAKTGLD